MFHYNTFWYLFLVIFDISIAIDKNYKYFTGYIIFFHFRLIPYYFYRKKCYIYHYISIKKSIKYFDYLHIRMALKYELYNNYMKFWICIKVTIKIKKMITSYAIILYLRKYKINNWLFVDLSSIAFDTFDIAPFDFPHYPRTELWRTEHVTQEYAHHIILLFGFSSFHVPAKCKKKKTK